MSFKIAFIGAGSIGFTRDILKDILSVPEFQNCEISFMDINEQNLNMSLELCQRDITHNGLDIKILATTDRREAFKDAKYIINCVRIGMLEAFKYDVEIPLKYGVDQCVGDTLCAGGIMYGQRGIPAILDFCRDIREVAKPNCIMLNYANPNAMMTWAANKYGGIKTIGLCHGVQNGHKLIAKAFGLDWKELDITCVGINHQTWYTSIKHNGIELKDKLLDSMLANEEIMATEKVRVDILKRFGYFSTESNGHLSEYLSWYRKRPEEIENWISLDKWINGETCGYYRHCTERRNWFETEFPEWIAADSLDYGTDKRGVEHGSYIIEGLETGRAYRGHFNVINNGAITNLPKDCVVEVPAYADASGINVPIYGDLPLGCAAICSQSIWVQRLAVEAAVNGEENLLKQAMMLDPLTGAVLNPDEIFQMTDEMLIACEEWLPQYKEVIERAKKRMSSGNIVPVKGYTGAARLKTKSIDELRSDKDASMKLFNKSANQN